MDLGIAGRTALVCGGSKGLGLGCAEAMVREGVNVVVVARGADALQAAVQRLEAAATGSPKPFVKRSRPTSRRPKAVPPPSPRTLTTTSS
jgi:3-oxoacyl-[acyl-carrier protein] reductase